MAGRWSLDVRIRPVRDDVALVSVAGEVDIATAPTWRSAWAPVLADPKLRLLVCDLSGLSFLGAAGVSVLLDTHAMLAARGAELHVVAETRVVLRPLAVTGLLNLLPVSPDVQSALR
jgi:anti-sigma B factor antagonist